MAGTSSGARATGRPAPDPLPSDQDASGRTLGTEEMALLADAIGSGTLTSTKGRFVKALEAQFAGLLGVQHVYACASGSAAVHTAIAAIDPEPGDEVITSPITDMGALTPILYQGAIPVFADVDPLTGNVTAETIAARISERTKAIIVTHLFGNPCRMGDILVLAHARRLPIIEDCAQALLARWNGRLVGSLGTLACFSLQQGKHITTGEGGLVATTDPALARRMFLFINKGWSYGDAQPDHHFLALNYRMSELQGAVAVAQLGKLARGVADRRATAASLTERLREIRGIHPPVIEPGSVHTYWRYCIRVDERVVPGGAVALGRLLQAHGIACLPRYIQKPAFMCELFQQQRTFGSSRYPFTLARPEALDYQHDRFPGAFAALDRMVVLPWNERYTAAHVDAIAGGIRDAVAQLRETSR
jgi:dTDP-4-amino-4,6-dideoxygalactose transaminase